MKINIVTIPSKYIIHRCPAEDSGIMACCGRTPFEVPETDKITTDPRLVTCRRGR